jgi:hypothetical protein
MVVAGQWTGLDAAALRHARMSIRAFAATTTRGDCRSPSYVQRHQ